MWASAAELDDQFSQIRFPPRFRRRQRLVSSRSWVAIDFTRRPSRAPVAWTRSTMMRLASSASRAQCTVALAAVA